jgi:spermidine/putrescine transport system substrate-binding protein
MKRLVLLVVLMLAGTSTAMADTLQLLTWKGYAPKELVDKFEKETGIKVEVTYSNNEEMIAKLRATRGAGFDLAQPSQDRISSVQEEIGIYQPIDYQDPGRNSSPSLLEAVKKNTWSAARPTPCLCWAPQLVVNAPGKAPRLEGYRPAVHGRISYRCRDPC